MHNSAFRFVGKQGYPSPKRTNQQIHKAYQFAMWGLNADDGHAPGGSLSSA
jgi:hypothetical protein